MRAATLLLALALALPLFPAPLPAQPSASAAPPDTAPGFDVRQVADGVYAVIRREAPGLWFEANNVFIVGEHDVVVVDANFTPSATRQVLAALRRVTDRPVRYVVNTHWHDDHVTGNQVYADSFPGVEFIGHASARADMAGVGETNRRQAREGAPGLAARMRALVDSGKTFDGRAMTDEDRAGYRTTIALAERYAAEGGGVRIIPPTIEVDDRLVLRRGERTIEVLHLGGGHTGADLVVHLPREGVVVAGDLVVWPVPLVGSTSAPDAFRGSLERLLALRPRVIVPGHGPVMQGDAYARTVLGLLESLTRQTRAAKARGETLEEARRSVDLEEHRRLIAGDSPFRSFVFQAYVAGPGVEAAYREAPAAP